MNVTRAKCRPFLLHVFAITAVKRRKEEFMMANDITD